MSAIIRGCCPCRNDTVLHRTSVELKIVRWGIKSSLPSLVTVGHWIGYEHDGQPPGWVGGSLSAGAGDLVLIWPSLFGREWLTEGVDPVIQHAVVLGNLDGYTGNPVTDTSNFSIVRPWDFNVRRGAAEAGPWPVSEIHTGTLEVLDNQDPSWSWEPMSATDTLTVRGDGCASDQVSRAQGSMRVTAANGDVVVHDGPVSLCGPYLPSASSSLFHGSLTGCVIDASGYTLTYESVRFIFGGRRTWLKLTQRMNLNDFGTPCQDITPADLVFPAAGTGISWQNTRDYRAGGCPLKSYSVPPVGGCVRECKFGYFQVRRSKLTYADGRAEECA